VVGCSRVCSRAALPAPVRTWRTVRLVGADSPRGPSWPRVLRVLHVFLRAFRWIHFVSEFLLHEVHGRSVLECQTICVGADGPRAHRGWSVIECAMLEVRGFSSDGLSQPRGQSAYASRTVRPVSADIPPRPCGRSARCLRTSSPNHSSRA
jgi:hypothetical protein